MNPQRPRPAGSAFDATVELVAQAGGPDRVAAFLGKARSTVYKWTDPDQSEGCPFATVALLTEHFGATAAAEHLSLRAGGVFVPIPPRGAAPKWGALTADAAEAFGAATAAIVRGLDPDGHEGGRISRREAEAILDDIDHALRDLAKLRGLAVEAMGR